MCYRQSVIGQGQIMGLVFVSVYNWTVDDVIVWLEDFVELPQYSEAFRINAVEGRILPR